MIRKLAVGAAFLLATAIASASPVDVVKIVNFSCPVCRASEFQNGVIKDAVEATGGRYVVAPIPEQDGTGAREEVYYASRSQGVPIADAVKESLFRGAQDMGQPFSDLTQVMVWLQGDLKPELHVDWQKLTTEAGADAAKASVGKAAQMTLDAGASQLPTYLILKNGVVVTSLDPNTVNKTSMAALRAAVIDAVNKASADKQ
ncbi:hypothetical protein F6X40_10560 [Paraburkholderia sp. UCT31]|uniref:hypothetical protein n=1 Tax=Paraburkholderia sp. UCT31 TaxID=2615209 RepID=UPI0016567B0B|nr:hypothetical protein [Paraburkholderia sp. UCT31]MBC8737249.1 hypothetical protein [Paraburkholderia sp. UCT31]